MKRMIRAAEYKDSMEKQDELYDICIDSIPPKKLLDEVIKWMGSDEAAHCLEDIANDYDLLPVED